MNNATRTEFDIMGDNTWITVVGRKAAERAFWEAALIDDSVALTHVEPPNPCHPVAILTTEKAWRKSHFGETPYKVLAVEQHLAKLRTERGIVRRTT